VIDTLMIGFALVASDMAIWSTGLPRNEVARLLIRLAIYAAYSAFLFSAGLSPFSEAPYADSRTLHVLAQILEVVWWLNGARLLSKVLDTILLPKTWRRQRLFEDVFGAVVFLAATVASLGFVLALPVRGLVATSGALAIVLGLAIQSTLSDVFAGIVINSTEPYQVGHWVTIDGVEGKVTEMNWRSTNLLSAQGEIVIVPNAVAAKAKIVNSSRPSALHGVRVSLDISSEVRPKVVLDALYRALESVRSILQDPAPYAAMKSAGAISFHYEATAFVDDMSKKLAVSNELYDLCYRHLSAAGVEFGPLTAVGSRQAASAPHDAKLALLRRVDLFAPLSPDEFSQLADSLLRRELDRGEVLLSPEDVPDRLTIVDSGVLSATAMEGAEQIEVGRLGPGEAVGEAGLLAGLPARVKLTTLTDCVVYQLKKDDLTPILKSNPDVARLMCQLLSRRQHMLDAIGTPTPAQKSDHSLFDWLLDGVRRLHDLSF
jgi:small-conductance mechanosensitive channel